MGPDSTSPPRRQGTGSRRCARLGVLFGAAADLSASPANGGTRVTLSLSAHVAIVDRL